uniref:Uncharacterized protein n=1 Tax=Rhizochromulina marina TaxID=1034831 RepID=A0A7S2WUG2_9STRA|mmetsp:Transcript_6347/g.18593  ORF Transcript_6347/g.18593 Transcript_6347/m.18593 type:complete len:112 (+) Transcript_6347:51-386(+)
MRWWAFGVSLVCLSFDAEGFQCALHRLARPGARGVMSRTHEGLLERRTCRRFGEQPGDQEGENKDGSAQPRRGLIGNEYDDLKPDFEFDAATLTAIGFGLIAFNFFVIANL